MDGRTLGNDNNKGSDLSGSLSHCMVTAPISGATEATVQGALPSFEHLPARGKAKLQVLREGLLGDVDSARRRNPLWHSAARFRIMPALRRFLVLIRWSIRIRAGGVFY